MEQLRGRNAVITGASRGLGVSIAKALAREGVNLALAARSADDLERVAKEVGALGVAAVAIPTDVTDEGERETLLRRASEELGPIDILVNNAGIEVLDAFHSYPPKEIEAVIAVNLTAPMLLTRQVLPEMIERGRGHIVNIASLAGKGGTPYETPYAATKAGLIMFSQCLRAELYDVPIGVSAVCPGFVADEGMYARVEAQGFPAPRALPATTPKKVADAVVKAIRTDAAELIVNPTPMRPLLALSEVFPQLNSRVHKLLGTIDYGRRVSTMKGSGRV